MNKKILVLNLGLIPLITGITISCSNSSHSSETIHEDTKIINQIEYKKIFLNNNEITSLDFIAKYPNDKIKQFVFDNKNIFINGDTTLINSLNDLEVNYLPNNENQTNIIFLKILIKKGFWYQNNKIEQDKDLEQNVKLFGFKNLPEKLNPDGGKNQWGLDISKYKSVIDLLNLKQSTSISLLDNQTLNKPLKMIPEFNKLNLKISNKSNTKEQKLILVLSGEYGGEKIDNEIEITGFWNFKNQNFKITNLKLDKNNWFENTKPITNSSNIDDILQIEINDWNNKYIQNYLVSNVLGNIIISKNEIRNYNLSFNFSGIQIENKNTIIFKQPNLFIQNKKYDETSASWINDGDLVDVSYVSGKENLPYVDIPTLNNVKEFMIDILEINFQKFQTTYPSYWLGAAYFYEKLKFNNFSANEIIENIDSFEKFKINYFNNKSISFNFDINNIRANDFDRKLNFNIYLLIDGNEERQFSKEFTINSDNLKNINLNQNISTQKENYVLIKKDQSFEKNIIKYLKLKNKKEIDELFNNINGSNIVLENIEKKYLIPQIIDNRSIIRYDDSEENIIQNWNKINQLIGISLFGDEINLSTDKNLEINSNNTLNSNSRLFKDHDGNLFVIEGFQYVFDNNLNLKITKHNDNVIQITFKAKTDVSFSDNVNKEYLTTFSLIVLKSQWTNVR